jgi:redox-sensitive bicupin YhaK (pirin superfamily)
MGNKGIISSGDVQWMTAGSGVIHQEMPKGDSEGRMLGFQLWAKLPASHKMIDPKYRDVSSKQIPERRFEPFSNELAGRPRPGISSHCPTLRFNLLWHIVTLPVPFSGNSYP